MEIKLEIRTSLLSAVTARSMVLAPNSHYLKIDVQTKCVSGN